ncbi:CLUMA_CG013645, isoform A [Clunio marinus]|uniref:CLUMA_CG013645, isoform A n=1 Tax=Clunio marinus TaxID=568069 RepID=A0A1J1IPF8_9DIPT|nr:CLUMA_CG013645, isoform A [Clunio marinus]
MSTHMEVMQLVLLRESLRKQLDEYELLKSIYSMPGEFQTDNSRLFDDIQEFLRGTRLSVDEKLDFRIKIQMSENVKVELSVMLGQLYPTHESPIIMIRTDSLNKHQEMRIKQAIENFIETEVDKSEPYMYQVILWLQDNFDDIITIENQTTNSVKDENEAETVQREWIWSHHIYSKIKRQDINKLCKNHQLNGFMWPGKPGVICIEGPSESVREVVKIIKSWQWKKLKIIKTETSDANDLKFLRFNGFEEIMTGEDCDGENVTMDNGRFFKYLENHQSSYMKMELFGFQ